MTYWHWPTSFGFVVIDDQSEAKDERDALIGYRKQEFKNEYGQHTALRKYCFFCRGFSCSYIQSIEMQD